MSELLGRAGEFRRQIDADEARLQEQKQLKLEQERLDAIQHQADVVQSAQRARECAELLVEHNAPRIELWACCTGSGVHRGRVSIIGTGWIVSKPAQYPGRCEDMIYVPGIMLLSNGLSYQWSFDANMIQDEYQERMFKFVRKPLDLTQPIKPFVGIDMFEEGAYVRGGGTKLERVRNTSDLAVEAEYAGQRGLDILGFLLAEHGVVK